MTMDADWSHTPLRRPEPVRPADCPVEDWLGFLGHRWNALILWHLRERPRRHAELAAMLPGVSPKVLSERLAELRRRQLVRRELKPTFPRGTAYSLSPAGAGLLPILDQMERWSRHAAVVASASAQGRSN